MRLYGRRIFTATSAVCSLGCLMVIGCWLIGYHRFEFAALTVSTPLIAAVLGLPPILYFLSRRRVAGYRKPASSSRCSACGYRLNAAADVCPECGTRIYRQPGFSTRLAK